jgi:carboxyl-terminal processing protease
MIRKVTLLAVGALMGATAVSAINSYGGSANAAGTETYRQLAIFGNVFERVRAQYVDPAGGKQAYRECHRRHADLA